MQSQSLSCSESIHPAGQSHRFLLRCQRWLNKAFSEGHQTGVEFSRQIKGTPGQNLSLLKGKTFRGKDLGAKMGLLKVAAGGLGSGASIKAGRDHREREVGNGVQTGQPSFE